VSDGRTLLLLGADGFVGTHLAAAAAAADLRVVRATRKPGSDLRFDLTDPDSVKEAVRLASPDLVVNMAGLASAGQSWRQPAETFIVNALGIVNLLEAVAVHAQGAHVTCVSSAEVYGAATGEQLPLREEHPIEPLNPYGASKASMELICGQYARSRGLRIAVIRAFNQLGPGQSPQFVASDFARQVAAAELGGHDTAELSVGNLAVIRDFVDVRDAARAYLAVVQRQLEGPFNLCSGRAIELKTLIDEIGRATPLTIVVKPARARGRPAEAPAIVGSSERLQRATGWAPKIPLRQTASDLMEWWRAELREGGGVEATERTGVSR
jgi:GDP-4-dehydro-6-deoxy-D-mannose reductase